MTKRKPKAPYKTADELFSKIVRLRDRYCVHCGTPSNLQAAHGFSRAYRSIRWDERNCWALCAKDHVYFTHRPIEWDSWLQAKWGEELYWHMRHTALNSPNPDTKEVVALLRPRLAELEAVA